MFTSILSTNMLYNQIGLIFLTDRDGINWVGGSYRILPYSIVLGSGYTPDSHRLDYIFRVDDTNFWLCYRDPIYLFNEKKIIITVVIIQNIKKVTSGNLIQFFLTFLFLFLDFFTYKSKQKGSLNSNNSKIALYINKF